MQAETVLATFQTALDAVWLADTAGRSMAACWPLVTIEVRETPDGFTVVRITRQGMETQ